MQTHVSIFASKRFNLTDAWEGEVGRKIGKLMSYADIHYGCLLT